MENVLISLVVAISNKKAEVREAKRIKRNEEEKVKRAEARVEKLEIVSEAANNELAKMLERSLEIPMLMNNVTETEIITLKEEANELAKTIIVKEAEILTTEDKIMVAEEKIERIEKGIKDLGLDKLEAELLELETKAKEEKEKEMTKKEGIESGTTITSKTSKEENKNGGNEMTKETMLVKESKETATVEFPIAVRTTAKGGLIIAEKLILTKEVKAITVVSATLAERTTAQGGLIIIIDAGEMLTVDLPVVKTVREGTEYEKAVARFVIIRAVLIKSLRTLGLKEREYKAISKKISKVDLRIKTVAKEHKFRTEVEKKLEKSIASLKEELRTLKKEGKMALIPDVKVGYDELKSVQTWIKKQYKALKGQQIYVDKITNKIQDIENSDVIVRKELKAAFLLEVVTNYVEWNKQGMYIINEVTPATNVEPKRTATFEAGTEFKQRSESLSGFRATSEKMRVALKTALISKVSKHYGLNAIGQMSLKSAMSLNDSLFNNGMGTKERSIVRTDLVALSSNLTSRSECITAQAGKKLKLKNFTENLETVTKNKKIVVNEFMKNVVDSITDRLAEEEIYITIDTTRLTMNYKQVSTFVPAGTVGTTTVNGVKYISVIKEDGKEILYTGSTMKTDGTMGDSIDAFAEQLFRTAIEFKKAAEEGRTIVIKLYPAEKINKKDKNENSLTYFGTKQQVAVASALSVARKYAYVVSDKMIKKDPELKGHIGGSFTSYNGVHKKLASVEDVYNLFIGKATDLRAIGLYDIITNPERLFKGTRTNSEDSKLASKIGLVSRKHLNFFNTGEDLVINSESTKLGLRVYFIGEDGKPMQSSGVVRYKATSEHGDLYTAFHLDGTETNLPTAEYLTPAGIMNKKDGTARTPEEIKEIILSDNKIRCTSLKAKSAVNINIKGFVAKDEKIQKAMEDFCGMVPFVNGGIVNKKEKSIAGEQTRQFVNQVKSNEKFDGTFVYKQTMKLPSFDLLKDGIEGKIVDMDGNEYKAVAMATTLGIDETKYSLLDNGKGHSRNSFWNHQGVSVIKAILGTEIAEDLALNDSEVTAKNLSIHGYKTVMAKLKRVEGGEDIILDLNKGLYEILFNNERSTDPAKLGKKFVETWNGDVVISVEGEITEDGSKKTDKKYTKVTASSSQSELFYILKDDLKIYKLEEDKDGDIKSLTKLGAIRKAPVGDYIGIDWMNANRRVLEFMASKNISLDDPKSILNVEDLSDEDKLNITEVLTAMSEATSVEIYENRFMTIDNKKINQALPVDFNAVVKMSQMLKYIALDLFAYTKSERKNNKENVAKVQTVLDVINDNPFIKIDEIVELVQSFNPEAAFTSDKHNRRDLTTAMSLLINKQFRNRDKVFSKSAKEIYCKKVGKSVYASVRTMEGIEQGTVVVSSDYRNAMGANSYKETFALLSRQPFTGSVGAGVRVIFSDNVETNVVLCNVIDLSWMMGDVDGDLVSLIAVPKKIATKFMALLTKGFAELTMEGFEARRDDTIFDYDKVLDFSKEATEERQEAFYESVQPQFEATGLVSAGLMKLVTVAEDAGVSIDVTRNYQLEAVKTLSQIPIAAKNTVYASGEGKDERTTSEKLASYMGEYGSSMDVSMFMNMLKLADIKETI